MPQKSNYANQIWIFGCVSFALFLHGCGWKEGVTVSLENLSAFQPVAANWEIAGGAEVDLSGDKLLSPTPGKGVLYCFPTKAAKDNLFTRFKHGDIELEVEVMVPVNSNSGLYLQGRYEVQILDSWGKKEAGYSDIGGIYQRWDPSRGKGNEGYEGHAPLLNAAKAPGQWQSFKIVFRAPRFDNGGNKTANARFEEVWLNGQLVQKNVEVTGPTRASPFFDEVAVGPLMIQGDHGPVALSNLRYRIVQ